MQDPVNEIRSVVRAITEPNNSNEILANVDKYFTKDAIIVHPMLNSPQGAGIEGVKAAYKMLKVLTYGSKIDFHTVGFDRIITRKGDEYQTGLLDLTEHLSLRFLPLPVKLNPTFHIRFLIRIDLRKNATDGLWYIAKQEDNLPSDFGSTGLHFLPYDTQIFNTFKWACGMGTWLVGSTLTKMNLIATS